MTDISNRAESSSLLTQKLEFQNPSQQDTARRLCQPVRAGSDTGCSWPGAGVRAQQRCDSPLSEWPDGAGKHLSEAAFTRPAVPSLCL